MQAEKNMRRVSREITVWIFFYRTFDYCGFSGVWNTGHLPFEAAAPVTCFYCPRSVTLCERYHRPSVVVCFSPAATLHHKVSQWI